MLLEEKEKKKVRGYLTWIAGKFVIGRGFTIIVADDGLKILLRLIYYANYIYLLRCQYSGGTHLFSMLLHYQL